MPAISRVDDMSRGHGCYPPRPAVRGSADVFCNGIAINRRGDLWDVHGCGVCSPHDGILFMGSSSVYANGQNMGRVDDPIDCEQDGDIDDYVGEGSSDVFAGG